MRFLVFITYDQIKQINFISFYLWYMWLQYLTYVFISNSILNGWHVNSFILTYASQWWLLYDLLVWQHNRNFPLTLVWSFATLRLRHALMLWIKSRLISTWNIHLKGAPLYQLYSNYDLCYDHRAKLILVWVIFNLNLPIIMSISSYQPHIYFRSLNNMRHGLPYL